MAKTSSLFNLYKSKIERCKSGSELIGIAHEIQVADIRRQEKMALHLACVLAAKYFDKHSSPAAPPDPMPLDADYEAASS